MSVTCRFGALGVCLFALVLTTGVGQAGAGGSNFKLRVLQLRLVRIENQGWTGPYWNNDTSPPTPPPVGEEAHFAGLVFNNAAEFGKAANARVGRFLLDCTVSTEAGDGFCVGIVHVPDGFFVIAGNGPFVDASVRHYAVTGGVGAYSTSRGQMTTISGDRGCHGHPLLLIVKWCRWEGDDAHQPGSVLLGCRSSRGVSRFGTFRRQ